MKTKVISMAVTDEEYNTIRKAAYKDSMKDNKSLSVSAFTLDIVMKHINGNRPPPQEPYIEDSEKPYIEDSEKPYIEDPEIRSQEVESESGDLFKDLTL